MSLEVKLPDLGDNISSGTVVSIFVSAGDTVTAEQGLLELETDKAVIEVPSPQAGKVLKILVNNGDEVKVGEPIMELEGEAASAAQPEIEDPAKKEKVTPEPKTEPEPKPSADVKQTARSVDFKIPNMGDNVDSGSVTSILVKIGDSVVIDQGLVELETDKAVIEVPSDVNGIIKEILIKDGDTVNIDQKIMVIESVEADNGAISQEKPAPIESKQAAPQPKPEISESSAEAAAPVAPAKVIASPSSKIVPASPSVRRFAREIGISIHDVSGTGPGGRISVDDVKAYSKSLHQQGFAAEPGATAMPAVSLPDFSKYGTIETEPLNKLRQTAARNLSHAWQTIPHVTQMDKADITDLERLRKANAKKAEAAGGKLTMTAILVKVIQAALQKFPEFNASIDMANKTIIYKKYFNIGIAVDTNRGLLVPVIKDVEKKNIIQLAVELSEIAQKSRDKKLTMDEMQGGNFSISNLGGIGGTGFTPIVNSPDVAILGVSRAETLPVFIDGEFKPRLMMPLSLSYDHRIIDGAAAARFLRWVCQVLEEPFNVLLEG